jgi:hypothetical protein
MLFSDNKSYSDRSEVSFPISLGILVSWLLFNQLQNHFNIWLKLLEMINNK